jgi:anaerobic selenocysteine-containing dehydrogenase
MLSERLVAQGLDGLPDYLPNHEVPTADSAYPLAMISPPARHFLNSTFVNVTSLRDVEGEPLLEIHPLDAQARGLNEGQTVTVFNARGQHICRARVTDRTRPGVVVGLGVWWRRHGMNGTNVNELTSQALTDLGRAPTFYDCAVQVTANPTG